MSGLTFRRIDPATLPAATGFSHGITVGSLLFVSGQVGADENGVFGVGIVEQFDRAIRNVLQVVEAAGGTRQGIVSLTIYCTELRGYKHEVERIDKTWQTLTEVPFPALTSVGVSELWEPAALLEIQAVAVVGALHEDD